MTTNCLDSFFHYLPNEIVAYVFSFLPLRDRMIASSVCRHFKEISKADFLWEKDLKERRFEFRPGDAKNQWFKHIQSLHFIFKKNIPTGSLKPSYFNRYEVDQNLNKIILNKINKLSEINTDISKFLEKKKINLLLEEERDLLEREISDIFYETSSIDDSVVSLSIKNNSDPTFERVAKRIDKININDLIDVVYHDHPLKTIGLLIKKVVLSTEDILSNEKDILSKAIYWNKAPELISLLSTHFKVTINHIILVIERRYSEEILECLLRSFDVSSINNPDDYVTSMASQGYSEKVVRYFFPYLKGKIHLYYMLFYKQDLNECVKIAESIEEIDEHILEVAVVRQYNEEFILKLLQKLKFNERLNNLTLLIKSNYSDELIELLLSKGVTVENSDIEEVLLNKRTEQLVLLLLNQMRKIDKRLIQMAEAAGYSQEMLEKMENMPGKKNCLVM